MKAVHFTPVAVANRLTFVDQADNVKKLSASHGNQVANADGFKVQRTKLNSYKDQEATDVFNGTLGFMVMPVDEWLALDPYDANRPWKERFEDKAHLRGMLESPLQTLGYALVKADGTPICRLDGNGRAGAWMAGALEKPEFVHVITIVLPEGVSQVDYYVSNLFDTLNGDAQKVSPEHKAYIAKQRLIKAGKWVEFDSPMVKNMNKTAFVGLGTYLEKPEGQAKNQTATDWQFVNKDVVFLMDKLGFDPDNVLAKFANCYTASVAHCMLRTLAGFGNVKGEPKSDNVAKKAFIFWSHWKPESENEMVADLYNKVATSDQSGSKGTTAVKELIMGTFQLFRDTVSVGPDYQLPSFAQWMNEKQEAAAQALKDAEKAEKEAEQAAKVASVMDNPLTDADRKDKVKEVVNLIDSGMPKEGIIASLVADKYSLEDAETLYKEAGGKDETAVVVAPESETLEGLAPVVGNPDQDAIDFAMGLLQSGVKFGSVMDEVKAKFNKTKEEAKAITNKAKELLD